MKTSFKPLLLIFTFVALIHFVTSQSCMRCAPASCEEGESSNNGSPISTSFKGTAFRGVPGKKGPKGDPGLKGEPGSLETDEEVTFLKNKISHLETKLSLAEKQCEDWMEWKEKLLAPKTCSDISPKVDGIYTIRPSPFLESFQVNCLFRDGADMTVFTHDSESEIEALPKCEAAGCYRRDVTYRVDIQQIKAVMQLSHTCRQHVKYRCIGSVIGGVVGGWMSSDSTKRYYWGGASISSDRCACGETGSCTTADLKCNCDKNSGSHVDEGYLTYHPHLPVSAVFFGDLGDPGEQGFHTIGPLECF